MCLAIPRVWLLVLLLGLDAIAADVCDPGGGGGDYCIFANDGDCDEDKIGSVSCSRGTDCTDCGSGRRRGGGPPSRRRTYYSPPSRRRTYSNNVNSGCTWNDNAAQEDFLNHMYGGSIAAAVLGTCLLVAVSLPLCCGIGKQYGKVIAAVASLIAILVVTIPLMSSSNSCKIVKDDLCAACPSGCTEAEEDEFVSLCTAFGTIVAYTLGLGFIGAIMGSIVMCMGCCICCGCGAAGGDDRAKVVVISGPQGGIVPGAQVVGSPVVGSPVTMKVA